MRPIETTERLLHNKTSTELGESAEEPARSSPRPIAGSKQRYDTKSSGELDARFAEMDISYSGYRSPARPMMIARARPLNASNPQSDTEEPGFSFDSAKGRSVRTPSPYEFGQNLAYEQNHSLMPLCPRPKMPYARELSPELGASDVFEHQERRSPSPTLLELNNPFHKDPALRPLSPRAQVPYAWQQSPQLHAASLGSRTSEDRDRLLLQNVCGTSPRNPARFELPPPISRSEPMTPRTSSDAYSRRGFVPDDHASERRSLSRSRERRNGPVELSRPSYTGSGKRPSTSQLPSTRGRLSEG